MSTDAAHELASRLAAPYSGPGRPDRGRRPGPPILDDERVRIVIRPDRVRRPVF